MPVPSRLHQDLPRNEADDCAPSELEAAQADSSVQAVCPLPDRFEDLAVVCGHADWDALPLLLDLACRVASLINNLDLFEVRILRDD